MAFAFKWNWCIEIGIGDRIIVCEMWQSSCGWSVANGRENGSSGWHYEFIAKSGVKSVRRYSLCILFLWLSMWVKRKRRYQSNKWLQVLLMPLQAFGVKELLSWKNSDFFYFLWWNVFSKLFTDRKTHKGTGKVWRNILRRGKLVKSEYL